jgi:5-methylcytosine-specific restriction endonuclease McrA
VPSPLLKLNKVPLYHCLFESREYHVIPLAEGGDDAVANVAALCPICHREQHYSRDKLYKRELLKDALNALT